MKNINWKIKRIKNNKEAVPGDILQVDTNKKRKKNNNSVAYKKNVNRDIGKEVGTGTKNGGGKNNGGNHKK